ncbi:MAG: hypothetical protein KJ065_20590, partial [Anaerolineae bacterium]|nr:hypothetical protein [Anaerolineae bacterium]
MKCRLVFAASILLLALAVPLAAQEETDISVNLMPYEGNPILTIDEGADWERGGIWRPRVIAHDGLLHMFYLGFLEYQAAGSVCYATSEDGVNWTKHADNPVFIPDETVAPNGVQGFSVFHDGENWTLYFIPWREGYLFYNLADHFLMATAPSPTGPWSIAEEPVLSTESALEWDYGGIWPLSLLHTADEYVLYFETITYPYNIGMATSPDGIAWTKYDDPATASGRYELTDPIFRQNTDTSAWDSGYVTNPVVRQTTDGWEM